MICTDSPFSNLDETNLMHSGFNIRNPWLFAQVSTANTLLISVAVVITGIAFNISDIFNANSLAPPMCPERIGIENCPNSSTTTTAGSFVLVLM